MLERLSVHLLSYKMAVFDCDGVLLDSNAVKTNAFEEVLRNMGQPEEKISELIAYHKAHGGVSRHVKFKVFFEEIAPHVDSEKKSYEAIQSYGEVCEKGLMEAGLIPGVESCLQKYQEQGIPCFVVSGGEQKQVERVLEFKGLAQYFDCILGSPKTKTQNMDLIRGQGKLGLPGVFFGDAHSDKQAAAENGLDFVFVSDRSEWSEGLAVCQKEKHFILPDFSHIKWA